MITLQSITEENFLKAASLQVSEKQKEFVASSSLILARAYAYRNQRGKCWAIYHNDDMVGLAMLHDIVEAPSCYHLAEFMIDDKYQNFGYGQQALKLILEHCRAEGKFSAVEVCVKQANVSAIHIYEKEGFRNTGYIDPDAPDCLCMVCDLKKENTVSIQFKDIILRDREEKDIDDWVSWNTVETEWMDWDGPDIPCDPFDEAEFREKTLQALGVRGNNMRFGFEIDTSEGIHLGMVNSYWIGSNWEFLDSEQDGDVIGLALGIGICKGSYWGKGYGSQALTAFIRYLLDNGEKSIYLQTWSGNFRMICVAHKIGFLECNRFVGNRMIRGGVFDGLTFKLDIDRFNKYFAENT